MNNFHSVINNLEKDIYTKLKTDILKHESLKNKLKHNHQPTFDIVPNCEYCMTHGNIFQKTSQIQYIDKLKEYMYCFK